MATAEKPSISVFVHGARALARRVVVLRVVGAQNRGKYKQVRMPSFANQALRAFNVATPFSRVSHEPEVGGFHCESHSDVQGPLHVAAGWNSAGPITWQEDQAGRNLRSVAQSPL
jgi:hypothetical protein